MNLHKLILTENACYKAGRKIKVKGIMVHSTGANNPWLKRYVGPDDGKLGKNQYNNHWNTYHPGGREVCVHGFIGKLADGSIATYQTLPWDHRGWHAGGSANDTHIGFEICEDGLTDYTYFQKVYREAVELCAFLCKEYGLSVIRNPKGRGKTYSEWAAEKDGKPTLRSVIRSDIDRAILASTTQQNFQEAMQTMGYTFKTRTSDGQPLKYPALKPPGAKGYFRFHRLGPGYSLTEILDRVYDNVRRQTPFPEADRTAKIRHPFVPYPKAKGIHALYLRYCYELRIIQKHPASVKRVPYSMRQDLILLDKLDAETRFLAKHEYGSLVELESHKEKSTGRIQELEQERNALRSQLRAATRREDVPAVENLKSRIKEISSEIKTLRQEVKLCDGIEARSALMERNLEQLQQEQEIERKEEEQHELFRRGGRSGRPSELERR